MKFKMEPIFVIFIIGMLGYAFLAVEIDKEDHCEQTKKVENKVKNK